MPATVLLYGNGSEGAAPSGWIFSHISRRLATPYVSCNVLYLVPMLIGC